MAGLSTGAGAPVVKVYHEKSMILPDVSRVLACLYEKDVKFECVRDSYKDILRLQATRSVPVPLYDGPTFLQESRAICRYIAETYEQRGYPFLLGKDVLERASIEQWLRHEEHAFDPPSRALFCHLAFPLHDEDDDNINREKRKLEEVLAVYEQRLGESEFLAGNKFTLADLVHLPNTHHIVTSEKFAYLYDSRKNVQRWWNTISARDSWQQVLTDMKSVEEQYQKEHEQQQKQLQQQQQGQEQTEPPSTPAPPPPIQQVSPGAPTTTTTSADSRAPPPTSTPKQTPTDATNALAPGQGAAPSADGIGDEQTQKGIIQKQLQQQQQQGQGQTEPPSTPAPPPPIQQVSPGAPTTTSADSRAPPPTSTPKQTPTDATNALAPGQGAAPSADGIGDEQTQKGIMHKREPETTRQAPSSDTQDTSASITTAASKTPAREVPDDRDTGDDTTQKLDVDTKAAPTPPRQEQVSGSQQTAEQIKGVAPASHGITGDESAKIAMPDESATPPAGASDERVAATALKGGILDARGKNEAVKPSVADPRGIPTTPRRPAPTPDTQRPTTLDKASDQAPPFPSFPETRNEKTGIAEAGRTNTIAPDEQPGGRIPKNSGAPAAGPSPMKSQKNMNEAYNDGPSKQQLPSDQSRAQLTESKKKQGDDVKPLIETGKSKEDDLLANANKNNTGQAQVTSTDGPSKLQMQSDQNKLISSKDIGKRTNETVSYRSSETSREMLPSVPKKSTGENQLLGDKSSISLQDNVKQGSEAALSVSGTEQPKKRDLLANADQNKGKTTGEALQKSEERTSSDTQQAKNNTSNSKSDGSSKPTQFDGNEGNLPESHRRGSSTNP